MEQSNRREEVIDISHLYFNFQLTHSIPEEIQSVTDYWQGRGSRYCFGEFYMPRVPSKYFEVGVVTESTQQQNDSKNNITNHREKRKIIRAACLILNDSAYTIYFSFTRMR